MRTRIALDSVRPGEPMRPQARENQSRPENARSGARRRRPFIIVPLLAVLVAAGCSTASERNQPQAAAATPAPRSVEAKSVPPAISRDLPEDATLDDYLHYAVRHSPALETAYNEWRAALERVPQARSLPDPQLSFGYVVSQVDTRRSPRGETYRLSQMFPWFGTLRLRGDVALEEALAAEQRFEVERWNLFKRVTDAYYEYYFLERSLDILENNLELVRTLEQVVRTAFRANAAPHQDLIRIQVELGRVEDRLRHVEEHRDHVHAALNAALGRPVEAALPPPPAPEELVIQPLPHLDRHAHGHWLAVARESNPELQSLRHQSAARLQGVQLARRDAFPDIMVGVEYGRNTDARMARMDGGGTDMLGGMVAISVPLWRQKYRAAIAESEALLESAERRREDRQLQIETELERALAGLHDAERKLDLYGNTLLPLARQSLRVTEASYRAADPQTAFLDLVDSQRVLLEFELALERARADRFQRLADIERLLGRSLTAPAQPFSNTEPNNSFDGERK